MKLSRKITLIFMLLIVTKGISQEKASIERSIFGIDTGFFYLGFWINNESKLTSHLSLKSELSLQTKGISVNNKNYEGLIFFPTIALEPRYHLNIKKRAVNNRLVNNNGSFVAINLKYQPDLFAVPHNINPISNFSIAPKYGTRGNLGNHFNYETGLGFGYVHLLQKTDAKADDFYLDLTLRIGYNFKL